MDMGDWTGNCWVNIFFLHWSIHQKIGNLLGICVDFWTFGELSRRIWKYFGWMSLDNFAETSWTTVLGILGNPQNHWNLSGQDGEKLGVISTGVVNHKMFGCFVLFCAIYNYFEKYDKHFHFGDLECKKHLQNWFQCEMISMKHKENTPSMKHESYHIITFLRWNHFSNK